MSVLEALESVGLWWNALAVVVLVLGVGRFSRVVTYDNFPPAEAVRSLWTRLMVRWNKPAWDTLLRCQWCFTPWAMLAAGGWYVTSIYVEWLAYPWWILWSWLGISYLTSMIVARDDPAE